MAIQVIINILIVNKDTCKPDDAIKYTGQLLLMNTLDIKLDVIKLYVEDDPKKRRKRSSHGGDEKHEIKISDQTLESKTIFEKAITEKGQKESNFMALKEECKYVVSLCLQR